ncbi:MAG TPA: hypothetical protein VG818_08250 [Gemmatimonadaceae bacterium]|nr:hypothetical protein [Gemmatimonadaceae bacterium]
MAACCAALCTLGVATARAQVDRATVPCRGQRISAVNIFSQAPSVARVQRIPLLGALARDVHITTQPTVVERFLLLRSGDRCLEVRRAESERILRAQPFLADASVRAVANPDGTVDLEVTTIDEVSLVLGAAVKAQAPLLTGARLGNGNVDGMGLDAVGSWTHEPGLRAGYSARITNYQMFGVPLQSTVSAARNPLGGSYHLSLQRPFYTDLQRYAWRVQDGGSASYVRFVDPQQRTHVVRLDRQFWDVGWLTRLGPPGKFGVLGVSLSREDEFPGGDPQLLTSHGLVNDSSSAFDGRYTSRSASRVNALLGYRHIAFVQASGFDALRARQDVPVGFEVGTLIGKSASFLGSRDRDMIVAGDLYAGTATPTSALRLQLVGESHRNDTSSSWDGFLGSGRLARYQRIGQVHTLITSAEWSGGWEERIPFRVTLAGSEGGIRGFGAGTAQGAQRAVLRVEDRMALDPGTAPTADLGLAFFADAGRVWAGDVPYGVTTPVRYAAGVGLLAAIPARSDRLWRLDLIVPQRPGHGVGLTLRLTHMDATSVFWREPRDVAAARERTVPSSIFVWP